jgi:hypothetical protein
VVAVATASDATFSGEPALRLTWPDAVNASSTLPTTCWSSEVYCGSSAIAESASARRSRPLPISSSPILADNTSVTPPCVDNNIVARKLLAIPFCFPAPPGSAMPQPSSSRTQPSTPRLRISSVKLLPSRDDSSTASPRLPLNVFLTR